MFFCSQEYRNNIYGKMVRELGVEQLLIFDDTYWGVHPSQQKLLTGFGGYERALLPAASKTAISDVTVVVSAPPLPGELRIAKKIYESIGNYSFEVLFPWKGKVFDLLQCPEDFIKDRVVEFVNNKPADDPYFFKEFIGHYRITRGDRTLLWPFQTVDHHYQHYNFGIKLFSSAQFFNRKNHAIDFFNKNGLSDFVPEGFTISPEGPEIFAENIVKSMRNLENRGLPPYVKLNADGVSGLGNLHPGAWPDIYNPLLSDRERRQAVRAAMRIKNVSGRECEGRVERLIPQATDELGKLEFVVGGIMIMGCFWPTYIGRTMNNEHDIYEGMIHTDNEADFRMGLKTNDLLKLVEQFAVVAHQNGLYSNGYVYVDVIKHQASGLFGNDFNWRRGGRTVGEAIISILGGSYYDREFYVEMTDTYPHQIFDISERLEKEGAIQYGTPLTFFPQHNKFKVKVLIPKKLLSWDKNIHTSARQFIEEITA